MELWIQTWFGSYWQDHMHAAEVLWVGGNAARIEQVGDNSGVGWMSLGGFTWEIW